MTEAEWLACADPKPMLTFLGGRASDRKLRLFAVACCRRVLHLLDEAHRMSADLSEEYADTERRGGLHAARRVREQSSRRIDEEVYNAVADVDYCRAEARNWAASSVWEAARPRPATAAKAHRAAAVAVGWCQRADAQERGLVTDSLLRAGPSAREAEAQADMLRDIFGNPFRPAKLRKSWLKKNGGAVPRLAQAIYDERAFRRVPELADALADAGCTDTAFLGHLRGPGPHVRGCWAVDLILGKE
jgi:hypothetical protein